MFWAKRNGRPPKKVTSFVSGPIYSNGVACSSLKIFVLCVAVILRFYGFCLLPASTYGGGWSRSSYFGGKSDAAAATAWAELAWAVTVLMSVARSSKVRVKGRSLIMSEY